MALSAAKDSSKDPWEAVRLAMMLQPFVWNMNLIVGEGATGSDRLFQHERGRFPADRVVPVASSSKMLFVTRIMQLVDEGQVSLGAKVSEYLPFWTKDPSDSRSRIKVFHLMSFQSGYTFGLFTEPVCVFKPLEPISACVERLYHIYPHRAEPGTVWDYNEWHNQIAAAIVERVIGEPVIDILAEHLKSMNMTHSKYWHVGSLNATDPTTDVSAELITSADDYAEFVARYAAGRVVSPAAAALMEADHNQGLRCPLWSCALAWATGHYGLGNFYMCFDDFPPLSNLSVMPEMRQKCIDAKAHVDPGLFGFWPVWDRKLKYWLVLATLGLPEVADLTVTALMSTVLKPLIDRAVVTTRTGKSQNDESIPLNESSWARVRQVAEWRRAARAAIDSHDLAGSVL